MTRHFKLANLGCAVCAARMEKAIQKIPGVQSAAVKFLTQKLTIDAREEDFDEILRRAAQACRRIEPDCAIKT